MTNTTITAGDNTVPVPIARKQPRKSYPIHTAMRNSMSHRSKMMDLYGPKFKPRILKAHAKVKRNPDRTYFMG